MGAARMRVVCAVLKARSAIDVICFCFNTRMTGCVARAYFWVEIQGTPSTVPFERWSGVFGVTLQQRPIC